MRKRAYNYDDCIERIESIIDEWSMRGDYNKVDRAFEIILQHGGTEDDSGPDGIYSGMDIGDLNAVLDELNEMKGIWGSRKAMRKKSAVWKRAESYDDREIVEDFAAEMGEKHHLCGITVEDTAYQYYSNGVCDFVVNWSAPSTVNGVCGKYPIGASVEEVRAFADELYSLCDDIEGFELYGEKLF